MKNGQPPPVSKGGDNDELMDRLQSDLAKLKQMFDDRFNQLLQLIDKKADRIDLEMLEKKLNDRI